MAITTGRYKPLVDVKAATRKELLPVLKRKIKSKAIMGVAGRMPVHEEEKKADADVPLREEEKKEDAEAAAAHEGEREAAHEGERVAAHGGVAAPEGEREAALDEELNIEEFKGEGLV